MTTKVAALQNAVLAAAGTKVTIRDATLEALQSVTRFKELLDAHVFTESEQGRDVYRRGFERVLSWRADVLAGSAILEDLLTSREKLLDHARWWSPSYAVGGDLYSGFDVRPGDGVAVDQTNIQVWERPRCGLLQELTLHAPRTRMWRQMRLAADQPLHPHAGSTASGRPGVLLRARWVRGRPPIPGGRRDPMDDVRSDQSVPAAACVLLYQRDHSAIWKGHALQQGQFLVEVIGHVRALHPQAHG
jgi:hypothetical protein